ncbi:MAG: tetratricopeptide repeat protein [Chloroflexota bacterium]
MVIHKDAIRREHLWMLVIVEGIIGVILLFLVMQGFISRVSVPTDNLQTLTGDVLVSQAENRIANDDVRGGLALLDVTIAQGETSARVYGARAAAYAELGDYTNALSDYEQAALLAPTSIDFQFGVCYTGLRAENYQVASDGCGAVIQLDPQHTLAWNNRCYIRAYHLGAYTEALPDCTQAILLNTDHPYPYNNRARAYLMTGAYQLAINDATQSLTLNNPYAHMPLVNRGTAYMALGNAQAALNDFQSAIDAAPEYAETYARLGELYRWQNFPEAARQSYCQYLGLTDIPLQSIIERADELGGCN